jgi:electron transfer flavoprotein alpha subunit
MNKILLIPDCSSIGTHTTSQLAHLLAAVAHWRSASVDVLCIGHDLSDNALSSLKTKHIHQLHVFNDASLEHPSAEQISALVMSIAHTYTHIIAPANTFGKNFLPRVAALLDVMMISDVTEIIDETTFIRPIYAGNAVATVQSTDSKLVLSIRISSFPPVLLEKSSSPEIIRHQLPKDLSIISQGHYVSLDSPTVSRPQLEQARIVVSGGRALGSKEKFDQLIGGLADELGAAVGASRAAVDAGFASNDYQVGQTGKVIAPDIYMAVGISGAIQHTAGMKDSKTIVAINKDPDAPIFQIADYALVGDLFEVLPELQDALSKLKSEVEL